MTLFAVQVNLLTRRMFDRAQSSAVDRFLVVARVEVPHETLLTVRAPPLLPSIAPQAGALGSLSAVLGHIDLCCSDVVPLPA